MLDEPGALPRAQGPVVGSATHVLADASPAVSTIQMVSLARGRQTPRISLARHDTIYTQPFLLAGENQAFARRCAIMLDRKIEGTQHLPIVRRNSWIAYVFVWGVSSGYGNTGNLRGDLRGGRQTRSVDASRDAPTANIFPR